jgi:glycopeptide antibiotics resistance protein
MTGQISSRRPANMHWRVFLGASIAFIVYGSLVPFDFQATPFSVESIYSEWHIFQNGSDAIGNFLLFIPLGIALHACFTRTSERLIAALLAVLVLALGIQLIQLYLPSRFASLADVFWNTAGMGAGFSVASRVRRALDRRLASATSVHDYFAMLLVGLWFSYESFPFVPTLDIGLLRDHVKLAIVAPPFETMRLLQHALAAALGGVAALHARWLQPRGLNVAVLGGLSLVLEVCVAYGSLRRETLLGITLGLLGAYVLESHVKQHTRRAVFMIAGCAYLITILTPFHARAGVPGFTFLPFSNMLFFTRDIPPTAFEALAIASLLWASSSGSNADQKSAPGHRYAGVCAIIALVALLEWVRVYIVGFHGDTTPLVLAVVLAPFAVARQAGIRSQEMLESTHRRPLLAPAASFKRRVARPGFQRRAVWLGIAAAWLALALGLYWSIRLPGIPYNWASIFGGQPWRGAGFFSLALLWLGSGPWIVTQCVLHLDARRRHSTLWVPVLLIGIALLSFLLVDSAVPGAMLEKVIGAPDLYRRVVDENSWGIDWHIRFQAWPSGLIRSLERLVRYCALYSLFMIPATLAALAVARSERVPRVLANLILLLPCWWLAKCVVLDWAITDNLTELVAPGGLPFLSALIVVIAIHATVLANHARLPRFLLSAGIGSVVLLPATWWLVNQGIETMVVKYGSIFSGVQFLLGENRVLTLPEHVLFARWCLVYVSATGITALGMVFARWLWPVPSSRVCHRVNPPG